MVLIWLVALSADRLVPHRLLARLSGAMSRGVRSFSEAFAGYRQHPHAVAQSLLVGAAGWGFNLLALSVAARAIGVDLSWTVLAVCIPITLLVALAPFSINGLGHPRGRAGGAARPRAASRSRTPARSPCSSTSR